MAPPARNGDDSAYLQWCIDNLKPIEPDHYTLSQPLVATHDFILQGSWLHMRGNALLDGRGPGRTMILNNIIDGEFFAPVVTVAEFHSGNYQIRA